MLERLLVTSTDGQPLTAVVEFPTWEESIELLEYQTIIDPYLILRYRIMVTPQLFRGLVKSR